MSGGRKIDFAGRPWSAHAQDHWLEFAGNPNFPDYLRVAFVAYGRHAANGHAKLEPNELAHYLVREGAVLPDRRTIRRAIQKAVDLDLLLPESRVLCLVVSGHHVQGGVGDPARRCNRAHTVRTRRVAKDNTTGSRLAAKDYLSAGRLTAKDNSTGSRSVLSPSLSSTEPSHSPKAS